MLKIAICDDNTSFVQQITSVLDNWNNKPADIVYQTFENGDALVETHSKNPFDIILLDIVMPLINGIDVAREIRQNDKNVKIVFLTSSPEFAVESYTVKANNYLLKPLDEEKLYQCINEFHGEISSNARTVTVKGVHSVHKIPLTSVEYVEAQNKRIIFKLKDGDSIESTEPLHVHENVLSLHDGFFKCHRSYIININHIDTYTAKEIKMRSGCFIPVARSCQKQFEETYFSVIFGKAGEDI